MDDAMTKGNLAVFKRSSGRVLVRGTPRWCPWEAKLNFLSSAWRMMAETTPIYQPLPGKIIPRGEGS